MASQNTSTINDIPSIEIASVFQNLYSDRQHPAHNQHPSSPMRPSFSSSLPPDYSSALEVTRSSSSVRTSDDELPKYEGDPGDNALASSSVGAVPTAPGFCPTKRFQIETTGHPLIALPFPPKPVPIPIYSVSGTGDVGELAYTSLRDARSSSSSCVLVRAEDNSPACITTYRFGPSRPPKLLLLPACPSPQTVITSTDVANLLKADPPQNAESIDIISDGCTTRAQTIRTPLGTFRWRYGTRTERREVSSTVSSLLILERITTVTLARGKKQEERRRRIAHLVRSDEVRTEGSTKRTAGNGGRLEIDLREWTDAKGEGEEVERLVVSSCLVMLKKEVDRRRLHQMVVLMAGASGGP